MSKKSFIERVKEHGSYENSWDFEGLTCLVCLSTIKSWSNERWRTAYVKVNTSHPFHGKRYTHFWDAPEDEPEVHGGLTFSEVEPDGTWFGFDTNHYGDGLWTYEEIKDEVENLARQLLAVKEGGAR